MIQDEKNKEVNIDDGVLSALLEQRKKEMPATSGKLKHVSLWRKIKGQIIIFLFWIHNRPRKILKYPNKKLHKISTPIDFSKMSQAKIISIVRKMHGALTHQKTGMRLGIAAPQIGINKRIMIVRGVVLVNPTWTPSKAPCEEVTEGCYSVPDRMFKVDRAPYGWAKWFSVEGVPREYKLKGLDAIVFQHELDHLDGKCCIDVGYEMFRVKSDSKELSK
jgi:peptide deformylase